MNLLKVFIFDYIAIYQKYEKKILHNPHIFAGIIQIYNRHLQLYLKKIKIENAFKIDLKVYCIVCQSCGMFENLSYFFGKFV